MVDVECNNREVDRQLKEQFIHGLNDRCMLEEIIKELTAPNNDDQITSEGVLAWAKRVEGQRVQATILSTITELRQFDKVKIVKKVKEDNTTPTRHNRSVASMQILWQATHAEAVSGMWQDIHGLWQD